MELNYSNVIFRLNSSVGDVYEYYKDSSGNLDSRFDELMISFNYETDGYNDYILINNTILWNSENENTDSLNTDELYDICIQRFNNYKKFISKLNKHLKNEAS